MALDKGFVIRVVLHDSIMGDVVEQTFVAECRPDVDGIRTFAKSAGWPGCDVSLAEVPLLGGDGGTEISTWIENANRRETENDPLTARVNGIERNMNSLAKGQRRIEEMLAKMIEGAKSAGGVVRRVSDPELEKAAYVAGARLPAEPAPQLDADAPVPSRRRDAPMRTPEMLGSPEFRSNSMQTVGVPASSQVFSYEGGQDEDGLPKRVGLPRVGRTLYDGTQIAGAGDEDGMKKIGG